MPLVGVATNNWARVALVFLLAISTADCLSPCEDTIETRSPSPKGNYVAIASLRDCGATTDFSSIVTLQANWNAIPLGSERVFVARGKRALSLAWVASQTLRIQCPECKPSEVFVQKEMWRDIKVEFVIAASSRMPKNGPFSTCALGGE
jgi:hypothetical protein